MTTPILFLDLDGVLNHEIFYTSRPKNQEHWHERYFCPKTVKRLNRITDETKARIVFSSSHRFHFETFAELREGFILAGITGELIDITPKLKYVGYSYSVPRGCEIKAWMERNKDILGTITETKYAILDDDTDMLYWQRKSFFCTKGKGGLTEAIANRIIKHLK